MHIRVFHCRLDFWFDFPMFLVDFVIEISWVVMGSGWAVLGGFAKMLSSLNEKRYGERKE